MTKAGALFGECSGRAPGAARSAIHRRQSELKKITLGFRGLGFMNIGCRGLGFRGFGLGFAV